MSDIALCTYTECSVAALCKRSVLNTQPNPHRQAFLTEIEYDDDSKCVSFLPLHKTAEKLYLLATVPVRDTKRVKVSDLSGKRRGKTLLHQ